MQLLDSLKISKGTENRSIELWLGDLTQMPPEEAVDILVVSAYPDDYIPNKGTLIGALHQMGVSVDVLSKDKQVDLRGACSCWLSRKIEVNDPGIQFERILCFEPLKLGPPQDVVGDIFRSLVPFIYGEQQVTQIAMPLVSTGDVGAPLIEMVDALFTAAVNWMQSGLPLKRLKIVERSPIKAAEIKGAFGILKKQFQRAKDNIPYHIPNYDLFISYCHANVNEANYFMESLKTLKSDIRIFIDHEELTPGLAWQDKLYRSLDDCRKVLALYSPDYVKSKACQDEFNFTSLLNTRSGEKILFPVLLYDTELLPHMSKWQYIDCRFANKTKMRTACEQLLQELVKN